ncbi:MAG: hypothetical protein ABW217_14540 [Polyangiaceae bacterium]
MAAGSKEKELEDTLPGADEMAVSAEASELRRRLLQVASNDSAERQRAATLPPAAGEQPQSGGSALRSTLQFVRRRPAGNEEVTVTAVSGAPLPSREEPSSGGKVDSDEAEPRPSRARIVVPLVAGVLLVLVALVHRTLSSSEPVQGSALVAPKAAGLVLPPPRPDVSAPRSAAPAASASARVAGSASSATVPSATVPSATVPSATVPSAAGPSPVADTSRASGEDAARLVGTARSKAPRSNRAPVPRETTRASEASAPPSSPEPVIKGASPPESAPTAKPRPRLVEDAQRPGLLD